MRNKLLVLLFVLLLSFSLVSCKKGDKETPSTYNPQNQQIADPEDIDNPDGWWQQYTTAPSGKKNQPSANSQTPSKNADKPKASKDASKAEPSKKTPSKSNGDQPSAEPNYTKVDSDTMKYDISNGKDNGVATLTKSASNTYIKQSLEALNTYFSTSFSAKDTMCYSSTLPSMKSTNIVFIFNGSKKSKDTLQYVVRFENGNPVAFVTLTVDEQPSPLFFWPCATSGSDEYNAYLETFKTSIETSNAGAFDKGTSVYKSLFNDENVQEFLKW